MHTASSNCFDEGIFFIFLKSHPNYQGLFLETAHPVKFPDTVEKATGEKPAVPKEIQEMMNKPKKSFEISTYDELKSFLME